jgi:hypothetical protein
MFVVHSYVFTTLSLAGKPPPQSFSCDSLNEKAANYFSIALLEIIPI